MTLPIAMVLPECDIVSNRMGTDVLFKAQLMLTFVTNSETTKLRILLESFDTNGLSSFNSGNNLLTLFNELRWTLGSSTRLLVNQMKKCLYGYRIQYLEWSRQSYTSFIQDFELTARAISSIPVWM